MCKLGCRCSTLTTDLQGCLKLQQDGLTEEDLPGFDAEAPHLCLGHLDYLPRATSSYWWKKKIQFYQRSTFIWVIKYEPENPKHHQVPKHIIFHLREEKKCTGQNHKAIVKSDELREFVFSSLVSQPQSRKPTAETTRAACMFSTNVGLLAV